MKQIPVWVPWLVLAAYAAWASLIISIGLRWGVSAALMAVGATFASAIARSTADRFYRGRARA